MKPRPLRPCAVARLSFDTMRTRIDLVADFNESSANWRWHKVAQDCLDYCAHLLEDVTRSSYATSASGVLRSPRSSAGISISFTAEAQGTDRQSLSRLSIRYWECSAKRETAAQTKRSEE